MGTSIWRPVRAELRRILLSVPGIPDISYEEQGYTPTVGVAWIREAIEKGPSRTASLGSAGLTEEQGIYQLDLYWPKTGVKSEGEDLADKIRLAFWHGRGIASPGADFIRGQVLASSALRTVPGDTWVIFPVRIEFFFRRKTLQGFPVI